ncbi:hypothetical protein CASFOL_023217 [Castilleja foliolosa]|uniref:DOG1 domain-containing protein n=1 Tax=Castilleja foliolosa TaxID=1961234 RepID=A0ABD3CJX6_9LAMI
MEHNSTSTHNNEQTFQEFFEHWLVEQNKILNELVESTKEHELLQHFYLTDGFIQTPDESNLQVLVKRVIRHYEGYYVAKSKWAENHITAMFKPKWLSTLEDAILWIGGWRPTMAVHLLCAKAGIQIEARIADIMGGMETGDLSGICPIQLRMVDELQQETIRVENEITEMLAELQGTVGDGEIVDMNHYVNEMVRAEAEGRVDGAMARFKEELVRILKMADDLRLKTLKEVVEILTPLQGVYYLISAAELHLRIHEWGKNRDAKQA